MHRAREIFYGIGIGLLLIGCQPEPDAPKGETGIMPIPESEYELFSDLVLKNPSGRSQLKPITQHARETAKMRGRKLLKQLERYGAHGQLDAEEYIVSLNCQETVIPNHLLSRLANCPRLTTLDFSNSPIRDSKLKLIGRIHSLTHLNLSGCPINGPGLKFLASLHNLKSINLSLTS